MIKKKYHTVDVKGWCHIQRSCVLIWKHNLKKSAHISLNLNFKTLNNLNGKCFQPNDYKESYKLSTKKIYKIYFLNFKVNQLKIIMNGSINLRV
jgi:hypothetical protein